MSEVLRVFQARPRPGQEGAYEAFLASTTLPFLRAQKGMRQVMTGRRHGPGRMEIVVVTLWESPEALKAAAGKNWEAGVVDPKREAPLLEDHTCTHYELRP